jgi:hypothetical protein
MDKRKSVLVLIVGVLAVLSAGVMTGAISFSPMGDVFIEVFQGSVSDANFTLHGWDLDIIDADGIRVLLNGTAGTTDDYTIQVLILDGFGISVANSTRTIAYTSGVPSNEMFTILAPGITEAFTHIDLQITR